MILFNISVLSAFPDKPPGEKNKPYPKNPIHATAYGKEISLKSETPSDDSVSVAPLLFKFKEVDEPEAMVLVNFLGRVNATV